MDKSAPSRKAIIGWGVGMLAVLGLAYFIGAVGWPFYRTRQVVLEQAEWYNRNRGGASSLGPGPDLVDRLGPPEIAAKRLAAYMRRPNWIAPHKRSAIYLLAVCGRPADPYLLGLLRDRDPKLRAMAATRLGYPGHPKPEEIVPALVTALEDKDLSVSASALESLAVLGPKAVPELEKALSDCKPETAAMVRDAIRKIKEFQKKVPVWAGSSRK